MPKLPEIIFTLICGIFVAWLVTDFLGARYALFLFIFFPVFSVFCLFFAFYVGKRFLFVWQAAKFTLIGGFADIIDIKAFQMLVLLIPADLFAKAISFLVAVAIKYIGNREWVFHKTGKESIKEAGQFLLITLIGLIINLAAFHCATKLLPSGMLWTEVSIILAALAASVCNFLGYKFLVFKHHGGIIQKI